jgi:hypothetical protein
MSRPTVLFPGKLLWPQLEGNMKGLISCPEPGVPSINVKEKTVWVHVGGRVFLHLFEQDIASANTLAWSLGLTWAPKYRRPSEEYPWDDVPEDKRVE